MKLTKKGHATVRVEHEGRTLVVDPGVFTEPDATDGAEAILITHEHADHFSEEDVRGALEANPGMQVWTLRAVADQLSPAFPGRVHTVGDGDAFSAAGIDVEVHGELHAIIHPDIPQITNVGFLLGGAAFHPGDALTVPDASVATLLLPLHAPWSKISEVVDYIRAVAPQRAIDIHDGLLVDAARPIYDRVIEALGETQHTRLAAGDAVDL